MPNAKLKTRLDKLEPAAIEAWRDSWKRLIGRMVDHTPQAVDDRLERALEANREALEAQRRTSPGQDVAELEEALEGVPLHGLDLPALVAWFRSYELPDIDRPQLSYTPARIGQPPTEPPGVWEALEQVLKDEGRRGEAAAILLFILAGARAVREHQT